jgi:hypothetical protein
MLVYFRNGYRYKKETSLQQPGNSKSLTRDAPLVNLQTSTRQPNYSHVRHNCNSPTLAMALERIVASEVGILSSTYPDRQKLHGVRSGDQGGQGLGTARPIQTFCT